MGQKNGDYDGVVHSRIGVAFRFCSHAARVQVGCREQRPIERPTSGIPDRGVRGQVPAPTQRSDPRILFGARVEHVELQLHGQLVCDRGEEAGVCQDRHAVAVSTRNSIDHCTFKVLQSWKTFGWIGPTILSERVVDGPCSARGHTLMGRMIGGGDSYTHDLRGKQAPPEMLWHLEGCIFHSVLGRVKRGMIVGAFFETGSRGRAGVRWGGHFCSQYCAYK